MKLQPTIFHHYHGQHGRLLGRQTRVLRSEKVSRQLSSKLKNISDEYGTDELALGLNNSLSQHAYNSFNQQLCSSDLPNFLQDELRTSFSNQCDTLGPTDNIQCQSECDNLCNEFLPKDIMQHSTATPDLEADEAKTENDLVSNHKNHPIKSDWSWHRTLSFIYRHMILNSMNADNIQQTEKKTISWLCVLSGSIVALQVRFLQAAMDNLKTMQDNVSLPYKSQESLDAMSDDDRNIYISERNGKRQRFISAQSCFQANLHLFGLTTQMLTNLFSLFSRPCRLRNS
ncbi:MAG: hypothetical protein ABW104_06480 [Candidatus Thiodiazotropha sp. 6PLUC2]